VDALPPDAPALTRLACAIRAHTLAVLEISDYASAQARIVDQVPPDVRKAHMDDQRAYGGYWNDLIQAAAEAGELRADVDFFVARMLVLGALNWTAAWYAPERGTTATMIADQAASMVLNGVAAPQHRSGSTASAPARAKRRPSVRAKRP
jgi:TetR/AcrR family transcriptional regulator, cholesterol catabolism regulator